MVKENTDKPKRRTRAKKNTKKLPVQSATSANVIAALIFGVLSLFCFGPVAGIPAIIISHGEIRKINKKKGSNSDLNLAKIAMVLGIIGTSFYALIILTYITIFFLGALGVFAAMNASVI
ncbi:MAG: DUF4190 domain-containing protein [Pseudomonadota bacterium]